MKSSVIVTVLASLCTAFAHEAQPARKRNQVQHKSGGAVFAAEEYDPYLGLALRKLPGEDPAAAAPAKDGDGGSGNEPGGEVVKVEEKMSMSMPTQETEDKGFVEQVGDKIKDITGSG